MKKEKRIKTPVSKLELAKQSLYKREHELRHMEAVRNSHSFEPVEETAKRYGMNPSELIEVCLRNHVLLIRDNKGILQFDGTALDEAIRDPLKMERNRMKRFVIR